MAAIKVPGAGYERRELGMSLPVSAPFSLHIFPSHVCNLKCSYCLHSLPPDKTREKGFKKMLMDFGLFRKLINDAKAFPEKFKALVFAGWGEPLLHPQIADMVACAKSCNIAERIEIVSNGLLLTHEMTLKLVAAGLDRLRISIQGLSDEKYLAMSGVEAGFEDLVQNITFFFKHRSNTRLFVKTVGAAVPTSEEREKFNDIFGSISDEIAVEQVIPVISDIDHSRFGSEFTKRHCGGDADRVTVCPFPFYMSVIHPDGSYAPCCSPDRPMDFGNLGDTPVRDIWNGQLLRSFRIAHLEGRRGGVTVCRSCPRPQYDIQHGDNLDAYAERLLPLYGAGSRDKGKNR